MNTHLVDALRSRLAHATKADLVAAYWVAMLAASAVAIAVLRG